MNFRLKPPIAARTLLAMALAGMIGSGTAAAFGAAVAVDDSSKIIGTVDAVKLSANALAAADCSATGCDPNDPLGHGTHVAGIIGGDGFHSDEAYTGVAPGASIYSLRVLDANGSGQSSDVIAALDWLLANAASKGIKVVNLSLGKAVEESLVTDPLYATSASSLSLNDD